MDPVMINELPENGRTRHDKGAAELDISIESHVEASPVDSALDSPQTGMSLVEAFRKYFGPENGVELDLSRDWPDRPPIDFGDFDE